MSTFTLGDCKCYRQLAQQWWALPTRRLCSCNRVRCTFNPQGLGLAQFLAARVALSATALILTRTLIWLVAVHGLFSRPYLNL